MTETAEKMKAIRESTGLDRRAFCAKYEIPYRTMFEWEHGRRTPANYLITLLSRAVVADNQNKEKP